MITWLYAFAIVGSIACFSALLAFIVHKAFGHLDDDDDNN